VVELEQAIDVVLPAHNEGDGIAATLNEFYQTVVVEAGIPVRFVVCEDGSTDNTLAVLDELGKTLPILLVSSSERKGYSRAVVDGLRATTASVVAFIDSDGQCDPKDFPRLLEMLDQNDLIVGYRDPRHDFRYRKLMSRAFKVAYEVLFPVRLKDPSCPFLVLRQDALGEILSGHPGMLRQGFWWEFNARAAAAGLRVSQAPCHHRDRLAGTTKVYRPGRIPGIAVEHLRALFTLRRELRALHHHPAG
jgi:dolichol-phosphate mannosyltransferase